MAFKLRQAPCNQQHPEPQKEAQEQALEPTQGDLYQGDPSVTIWPIAGPNFKRLSFKTPAKCRISTRVNKRSSKRGSTAMSAPTTPFLQNKGANPDPTWRDFERFPRSPKRNKNPYQINIFHLILIISIYNANKSPSSQAFLQPHQYLVVFEEIGLFFNPSGLNEAWWENNTILTESVTTYLTSEH
jgi:hypothetical protein